MHDPKGYENIKLPGLKEGAISDRTGVAGAADHGGYLRRAADSPGHH